VLCPPLSSARPSDLTASRGGSGRDPINTFAVMEDVNDKLKLLNYEDAILKKRTDLKPLSRTYFALQGKPSEQFPYFAQLAVWALQQIGVDMEWSEWVRTGGGGHRAMGMLGEGQLRV